MPDATLPDPHRSEPLPDSQRLEHVRACSPFAGGLIDRYPGWLDDLQSSGRLDAGSSPPRNETLEGLITNTGLDAGLRRFRNREMLRIIWRDLSAVSPLRETLFDITRLAECCLDAALVHHQAAFQQRYGLPKDDDGKQQRLVVIGMGKLGGGELNLSSDIDIILCYPRSGSSDGPRRLSNDQYFVRLSRAVIRSLSELTADGFCFRVDTRLRPFGDSGPLCCSFDAMEQYYQRDGRDWERYALIKARPVAGDQKAGRDLLTILKPFVYRRYIDFGAVEALRDMRNSVEADAARKERLNDIKRGPGGIREIEFLVQGYQLLRGGREPALQSPSLHHALEHLVRLEILPEELARATSRDYAFMRDVENRIQAQRDQQTHTLPEGDDLLRLVRAMRYRDSDSLQSDIQQVRTRVRTAFESCFPGEQNPAEHDDENGAWLRLRAGESLDADLLTLAKRKPVGDFVARVRRFALSQRGAERLDRFMPMLLKRIRQRNLSDDVMDAVFDLVLAVARRSAYLSLLLHNPPALDRMLDLFTASDWISAEVTRYPALLDELIDPSLGRDLPGAAEMHRTRQRILQTQPDTEATLHHLNHMRRAFQLRIAVAELETSLGAREVQTALGALAESLVSATLDLAGREIQRRHGLLESSPLAVIAYGTLGAAELTYTSDLDLVFLYTGNNGVSDGKRPLTAEQYQTRLARRLLGLLSVATPSGRLYEVDMRLRPNGRAGLLVSSLTAFREYQSTKAWTWELQALSRSRPITGDAGVMEAFRDTRRSVLCRQRDPAKIRKEVGDMRERLRSGRESARGAGPDAWKDVPGGLVDIEFLAQSGVLECAAVFPRVIEASDTIGQLQGLGEAGWLGKGDIALLVDAHERLTRARHLACIQRLAPEPVEDLIAVREIYARYFSATE